VVRTTSHSFCAVCDHCRTTADRSARLAPTSELTVTRLNHIRGNVVAGLLNAGGQLTAPVNGPGLRIDNFSPNLAPTRIGSAIKRKEPARVHFPQLVASCGHEELQSPNYNNRPIRLGLEPHAWDEIAAMMAGVADADRRSPTQMRSDVRNSTIRRVGYLNSSLQRLM